MSGSEEKEDMCLCALETVMERYSFSEYAGQEAKMFTGGASEDFKDFISRAIIDCIKTAMEDALSDDLSLDISDN